jgi:apolipoprotein N-acyltransferase
MKWTQDQHDATLKLYHDLTVPHWGAQLIIWPESALPDWAESLTDYFSNLWQEAAVHRSQLLTGIQHYDAKTDKAYNSVLALSDKVQWYNKHHLVPFGEYFPVPEFIREWMRMMSLPHSDFAAGDAEQAPLSAAGQSIAVTICYEDAYGSTQLALLNKATLLVNVTNDAWFGDSTARHQHLQISRMRALEAGRPLLRAANDGISGIIDSHGRLTSQLSSFKSDVLTGVVQPRTGLTPYASMGNWPTMILCAILVAAMIWFPRTGRGTEKQ